MMPEIDTAFSRWTGACLIVAGILFLAIGALTPFLPLDDLRRSPIFFWRQILAVLIGILLLFGSIGIYLRQPERSRLGTTVAFIAGCLGSALLIAHEWTELFLARDLAVNFPEVFSDLENAAGLTPFDWGTILAAGSFALGWIALSISTILTGPFSRWAGLLVILGIFAVPAMTAALPMPYGPVIGSSIIALGFILFGRGVIRAGGPGELT